MNAICWRFGFSAKEHSATIHAPNECHRMLTINDFLQGGRFHPVHQQTNPLFHAHFTPRLKEEIPSTVPTSAFRHPDPLPPPMSGGKINYRLAMAHPKRATTLEPIAKYVSASTSAGRHVARDNLTGGPSADTNSLTIRLRYPETSADANPDAEDSEMIDYPPEDEETPQSRNLVSPSQVTYLRIGTQPHNSQISHEEGLTDMLSIIVAEIHQHSRTARFLAVSSWNINGVLIGSYPNAEILHDVEYSGLVQDSFFINREIAQLKEAVLFPLEVINPLERPQDAPIKLVCSETAYSSPCEIRNLEVGEIAAVVNIIDKDGAAQGVELTKNFQVAFEVAEIYDEVLGHFRGSSVEESSSRTLGEILRDLDCRIEIWVLPQRSSTTLHRWDQEAGYSIGCFLDEDVWKVHKQLFMEVHILRDQNAGEVRSGRTGNRWKGKGLAIR